MSSARAYLVSALLLGLLALGACGLGEESRELTCPDLVVVPDAARLSKFSGAGRDLTDVRFEVEIVEPAMECAFNDTDQAIEGEMLARFIVTRGPADVDGVAPFRYFIAIARTQGRRIVARQEFTLSVPFQEGQSRVGVTDQVEPRIPIGPNETGSEYQVYLGLALSKEELDYNRGTR